MNDCCTKQIEVSGFLPYYGKDNELSYNGKNPVGIIFLAPETNAGDITIYANGIYVTELAPGDSLTIFWENNGNEFCSKWTWKFTDPATDYVAVMTKTIKSVKIENPK